MVFDTLDRIVHMNFMPGRYRMGKQVNAYGETRYQVEYNHPVNGWLEIGCSDTIDEADNIIARNKSEMFVFAGYVKR